MLSTSPTEEIHVAHHLANGIDDIGQIQIARRDLVQHRGEEEEVLAINKSHFEIAEVLSFSNCNAA